jgi:hypothetical protein
VQPLGISPASLILAVAWTAFNFYYFIGLIWIFYGRSPSKPSH